MLWNELGWLSLLKKNSSFKHVLHTLIGPMWEFLSSIFPAKNILQYTADWWFLHQNQLGGKKIKKNALLTEAVGQWADCCYHKKGKMSRGESLDRWGRLCVAFEWKSAFKIRFAKLNTHKGAVWNCDIIHLLMKSQIITSAGEHFLHSLLQSCWKPTHNLIAPRFQWVIIDGFQMIWRLFSYTPSVCVDDLSLAPSSWLCATVLPCRRSNISVFSLHWCTTLPSVLAHVAHKRNPALHHRFQRDSLN